jgi:tRNA(Ile)-lysidine synthase
VSLEAAARDARYAALARSSKPRRMPADGAPREDQAETLLLQLLRGAGLKGMSACRVPAFRPRLAPAAAARCRAARAARIRRGEARRRRVTDPMNDDLRFDRALSAPRAVAADRGALARRGRRAVARGAASCRGAVAAR